MGGCSAFASIVVLSVVLGKFLGVAGKVNEFAGGAVSYSIFIFGGILPWNFSSNSVTTTGNRLVTNAAIKRKVYVPLRNRGIRAIKMQKGD